MGQGAIWPENVAIPEPNTEKVCRVTTRGIWPNSLNTEGPRLADKESYTQITEQNTTDTVAGKEWWAGVGWGGGQGGDKEEWGSRSVPDEDRSATED